VSITIGLEKLHKKSVNSFIYTTLFRLNVDSTKIQKLQMNNKTLKHNLYARYTTSVFQIKLFRCFTKMRKWWRRPSGICYVSWNGMLLKRHRLDKL